VAILTKKVLCPVTIYLHLRKIVDRCRTVFALQGYTGEQ